MSRLDGIAHGLADAVIAENEHLQVVPREKIELLLAVFVFAQGTLDFEVIAPAAQFQAVVAPVAQLLRELIERQIRPLPAEEEDRTRHH
jgi:hypothetical protein